MKNVLLVNKYETSLAMTEGSEYHVTMITGPAFRNRVNVSFLETAFRFVRISHFLFYRTHKITNDLNVSQDCHLIQLPTKYFPGTEGMLQTKDHPINPIINYQYSASFIIY